MPPRRRLSVTDALTPENLESLAAAVAGGRRATVYLIEATPSLGLPEGTSAKVVSVDGNTVTISPKGVNDELPFEAEELRMTRNPASGVTKAAPPAAKPTPAKVEIAEWTEPVAPPKPVKAAAVKPASTPVPPRPVAAPKPPAARKGKKGPDSVSVTIHAGPDNDWSVTVTHGARRPGKAQPVSPESVSRAVRELGDASVREAVEAVISHAREEAAQRVAELSRQLEVARSTLAALEQKDTE
ncbi:translation initiation factor [Rhodococcus sp. 1163]|uniref:DUF6319 family protein n=1 Tax=unclassified Rhodococcus (in: high G+C Gram-positive bacteria) TaxID=192944 RepID=UPI000A0270FB|nr:DUF6319 family protein [Rhodococcus sp. 1163]ORI20504.1 translation initiation factor [Rhodococcus sp. 1163]